MNFERKHQYFKKLVANTKNFINVTHTLTERHQMRLSYELSSKNVFTVGTEPQSAVKSISFGNLPQTLRLIIQDKLGKAIEDVSIVPAVKSLHVEGINYKINSSVCYVLEFIKELPCFVQPKYILLLGEKWHFCVKVYLPIKYNRCAHAYEVECQPSWLAVLPHDLIDSHKHRIYKKNNKTYAYTVFSVTEFHSDL